MIPKDLSLIDELLIDFLVNYNEDRENILKKLISKEAILVENKKHVNLSLVSDKKSLIY